MAVCVVYATFPDEATAATVARRVLDARLAACVTMWPARSLYWWQGALEDTGETLAYFKTRPEEAEALARAIEEAHPYDVPCVLALSSAAAPQAYEAWVREEAVGPRS